MSRLAGLLSGMIFRSWDNRNLQSAEPYLQYSTPTWVVYRLLLDVGLRAGAWNKLVVGECLLCLCQDDPYPKRNSGCSDSRT
jgi:hypothetical protein